MISHCVAVWWFYSLTDLYQTISFYSPPTMDAIIRLAGQSLPTFDGVDFASWRYSMVQYLKLLKLQHVLELTTPQLVEHEKTEGKITEAEAKLVAEQKAAATRLLVHSHLSASFKSYIEHSDVFTGWASLKDSFASADCEAQFHVRRKIASMKFINGGIQKDGKTLAKNDRTAMAVFLACLEKEFGMLPAGNVAGGIRDEDKIVTLSLALPPEFDPTIKLNRSKQYGEFKVSILREWEHMCEVNANQASSNSNYKKEDVGLFASSDRNRARYRRSDKANRSDVEVVCHECGGRGHIRPVCPSNPKNKAKFNNKEPGRSYRNMNEFKKAEGKPAFAMMCEDGDGKQKDGGQAVAEDDILVPEFDASDTRDEIVWVLDSGANRHIIPSPSYLDTMEQLPERIEVRGLKGKIVSGSVQGTVHVESKHAELQISNVLHISGSCPILSVSKITAAGATVTFSVHQGQIRNQYGILIGVAVKSNGLYLLRTKRHTAVGDEPSALVTDATISDHSLLMHHRLGHPAVLPKLSKKNGDDVDISPPGPDFCAPCAVAKSTKKSSKARSENKEMNEKLQPMEKVMIDLVGPFKVESIGGSAYFINFTDKSSRFTWSRFLKSKDQAYESIMEWVKLIPNQTKKRLSALQADNAGELSSQVLTAALTDLGITLYHSVPYEHESNSVVERANRSVLEGARALYHAAPHLPPFLWSEIVNTSSYLMNRRQRPSLNNKSPFELLYLRKPKLEHLRAIGAVAYAHIPKERQTGGKMAPRASLGYLVGYAGSNYRIYDPSRRGVYVYRSVIFDERNVIFGLPFKSETVEEKEKSSKVDLFDDAIDPVVSPVGANAPVNAPVNVSPPQASSAGVPAVAPVPSLTASRPRRAIMPTAKALENLVDAIDKAKPQSMALLAFLAKVGDEPSVAQALKDKDWRSSMEKELRAFKENDVYESVTPDEARECIPLRWIFRIKTAADGTRSHKSRLVAKGYLQASLAQDSNYAPVARSSSVRIVLALAARHGWNLSQLDAKSAFLQASIGSEVVHVSEPPGFESSPPRVWRLKRAVYGLRSSPKHWYITLSTYLKELGFIACQSDACVFVHPVKKVIVLLYVDDVIAASASKTAMNDVKKQICARFTVTDKDSVDVFLGLHIRQTSNGIRVNQSAYILDILSRFGMESASETPTPAYKLVGVSPLSDKAVDSGLIREMVGALQYLAGATRPDIAAAVGAVAQFQSSPTEVHLSALKRIMRYLKHTQNYALHYSSGSDHQLIQGWADADFAADTSTRRSRSGYVFIVGGGAVSWRSKLQSSVTLSTCEAELVSLSIAAQEAVYLRSFLKELGEQVDMPTVIGEDNQGTIKVLDSGQLSSRLKHVAVRHLYVKDAILRGDTKVVYTPSDVNPSDLLTKALPRDRLSSLLSLIGLNSG